MTSAMQALLDATPAQLAVISWHAPWCAPCLELAPELDRLAAAHPASLLVLRLNVEASRANEVGLGSRAGFALVCLHMQASF